MSNIHHLERSLRKLRLTRVGAEWHALEKRALAEGWTPSRYLLTLCNEELLWRESEKLRRYKKEARLPVAKTLSEYDFSQVPELNGAQFRQLCETNHLQSTTTVPGHSEAGGPCSDPAAAE